MGYYMDIICFSFNTNHHVIVHEFLINNNFLIGILNYLIEST